MSKEIQVDRLLRADALPHVFGVYSTRCLHRLLEFGTLARLKSEGFGAILLHEGQDIYTNGPTPVNGRYVYRNPKLVAAATFAIRVQGLKVVGYLNGPEWTAAGLSPIDALEEMCRHGWDGVFLDNAQISDDRDIMYDFCARLAGMFDPVIHHQSIKPFFDPVYGERVEYDGEWIKFFTHTRTGETNSVRPTMRYFKFQVSQATRADTSALGTYMLPSMWWSRQFQIPPPIRQQDRFMIVHIGEWMPRLPGMLCASWGSFGQHEEWHVKHYLPVWRAIQDEYADDPEGVLARLPYFPPRWSWESDVSNDEPNE